MGATGRAAEIDKHVRFTSSETSAAAVVRHFHQHERFMRTRSISGDPTIRAKNISFALIATCTGCLAAILFQIMALGSDYWISYRVIEKHTSVEIGHFGLWRICITDSINQDVRTVGNCGSVVIQKFGIPGWCMLAGICGIISLVMVLACFTISATQLFRICVNADPLCANHRPLSNKVAPVIIALLAGSMTLIFANLASQKVPSGTDVDIMHGFWLQVTGFVFTVFVLFSVAIESLWRPYPRNKPRTSESDVFQSFFPATSGDLIAQMNLASAYRETPINSGSFKKEESRVLRRSLSEGAAAAHRI